MKITGEGLMINSRRPEAVDVSVIAHAINSPT